MKSKKIVVALVSCALFVPAAADAKKPAATGTGKGKVTKPAKPPKPSPAVSFVLTGTIGVDEAGAPSLTVTGSNRHGVAYVGQVMGLDLSAAQLSTADANGDGSFDSADLQSGDAVVVVARRAKGSTLEQPLLVGKLVNLTNPYVEPVIEEPAVTEPAA